VFARGRHKAKYYLCVIAVLQLLTLYYSLPLKMYNKILCYTKIRLVLLFDSIYQQFNFLKWLPVLLIFCVKNNAVQCRLNVKWSFNLGYSVLS